MRVLLLTGESEFASAIGARLREEGQRVETARSADDATTAAQEGRFDLILAETGGVSDGLEFLRRYRSARGMVPVIILGPSPAEQTGREALREGAVDCIARTTAMDEVSLRCRQAHDRERLRAEAAALRALLGTEAIRDVLVADSDAMLAAVARASEAAAATSPMLVTGARGVGKTALARAAHRLSARSGRTLSMFDCSLRSAAEIPPALLENEGAGPRFSEAMRVEETMLLRNADQLDGSLQLRIAEAMAHDVVPLLLTASDSSALVPELAAALRRSTVHLPPLRQRPADVPALLAHFTQDAARRLRHPVSLSPEVLGVLLTYEWPGNVRELETGVNHAASIAGSRRVELRDFPHTHFAATTAGSITPAGLLLKPRVDAAERLALEEALAAAGGGRRAAAELLGISLRTLFYKLRRHGLE
ncbi:MAG: helix-turn-helix domain-containing protein [Gemmatimonadota bacterium]